MRVDVIEVVGLIALGLLLYTWVVFPAFVLFAARRKRPERPAVSGTLPNVSVIVAAHDEADTIGARIGNLLALDYPRDHVEIIVVSDGSTDDTVRVARSFEGVRVLDLPMNRGRATAHNSAAEGAAGQILVFTDAETEFDPGFLKEAVGWFEDPAIGCGAGSLTFRSRSALGEAEGAYWRFERKLRHAEFRLGCLPFASGACLLIRRELYRPIPAHGDIDNLLPLEVAEAGLRVFYEESARAWDYAVESHASHFRKRVRTAQRSARDILSRLPGLATAGRIRVVGVLVSHRLLRWATGYLAAVLAVATVWEIGRPGGGAWPWWTLLALQACYYGLCVLGRVLEASTNASPGALRMTAVSAYAFLTANAGFSVALAKVLLGRRITSYRG